MVTSLIQNVIKHVFIIFHAFENIQSKFRKGFGLKIIFTSFKINNYFSTKDKTPFVVYKFVLARCNTCHIGGICRHLKL